MFLGMWEFIGFLLHALHFLADYFQLKLRTNYLFFTQILFYFSNMYANAVAILCYVGNYYLSPVTMHKIQHSDWWKLRFILLNVYLVIQSCETLIWWGSNTIISFDTNTRSIILFLLYKSIYLYCNSTMQVLCRSKLLNHDNVVNIFE